MGIQKIEAMLQGKKTYLVVIISILTAVVSYLNGSLDLAGLVTAILASLGLGGIRSAIGKVTK